MSRRWLHMARIPILLACCSLAGCEATGAMFSSIRGGAESDARASAADAPIDAQVLAVYLQLMSDLVDGDLVTQADVFQQVSDDSRSSPTTTNRFKLALALAVPGHPNSNAEHAQQELSELLAAPELLLPEERLLASIQLQEVEERLIIDFQAQQTQSDAQAAMERQNSDTAQRILRLEGENRELRRRLAEAEATLEELTDIERSIRERESGPN